MSRFEHDGYAHRGSLAKDPNGYRVASQMARDAVGEITGGRDRHVIKRYEDVTRLKACGFPGATCGDDFYRCRIRNGVLGLI